MLRIAVLFTASLCIGCSGDDGKSTGGPFTTPDDPTTTTSTTSTTTGTSSTTTSTPTKTGTTVTTSTTDTGTPPTTGTTSTGTTSTGTTSTGTTSTTTAPASQAVGTSDCAYGFTGYSDPMPIAPEVHILGVYEPGGSGGIIDVEILRQTQMTLVLSAYSRTEWYLNVAAGTVLDAVVLNGYEDQFVFNVPAGVPVIQKSPYANWYGNYAYAWPSAPGGSDTQALVAAVEASLGLPMTSFHGCYNPGFLGLL